METGENSNSEVVELAITDHYQLEDEKMSSTDMTEEEIDEGLVIDKVVSQAIQSGDVDVVKGWINSLPQEQRKELINKYRILYKMQALHFACYHNQLEVAMVLMESGADPNVGDYMGRTALHCACCSTSRNDDSLEKLVQQLLGSISMELTDNEKCTPLHYAAKTGHSTVVALLLTKQANLEARDSAGDTPVHKAAEEGHAKTLMEMIKCVPLCVDFEGDDADTPLHRAAMYNHVEAADTLLKNHAKARAKNAKGETPLHKCVTNPGLQLAKLLLDAGAEADALDSDNHTPLYTACLFGNPNIVVLLLDHGVVPNAECLEAALTTNHKQVVKELLERPQWPKLLRHTFKAHTTTTTPFRMIIRTMPDIAEEILNKCTVAVDPDESSVYEVTFNYEFIEDFRDSIKNNSVEEVDRDHKMPRRLDSQKSELGAKPDKEDTYGLSFLEISSEKENGYSTEWGPVGFRKENHPLAIMVESGCLNLLAHPLVGSLLHHKWKKFGQYAYFLNIISFSLFLAFFIIFTFLVPNPQTEKCTAITQGNTTVASNSACDTSVAARIWIYISAVVVIVFSLYRLLWEIVILALNRLSYFCKWINWIEVTLHLCSIIFVWVFNTPCQCVYNWQWQIGIATMFLAWFCLLVYLSKFPLTGVYILMFLTVLKTFRTMIVLLVLLLMAFTLTFYMAFHKPIIMRSPFSHFGRSLVQTWTMTSGEYGFGSIFRLDPTGRGDTLEEIPFTSISYMLWIVFVIFMPILLSNLLTGLAVYDVKEIKSEAELTKLALQVEQVLTVEKLLPVKLRRWFITGFKCVEPGKKMKFCERLQFIIWGGKRYNTHNSLKNALHRYRDTEKKSSVIACTTLKDTGGNKTALKRSVEAPPTDVNVLLEEINTIKIRNEEAQRAMNEQMETIKSKMELILQELAKKQY